MAATSSRARSAPLRHDGATDVYGVFSSSRRVQPRYQGAWNQTVSSSPEFLRKVPI